MEDTDSILKFKKKKKKGQRLGALSSLKVLIYNLFLEMLSSNIFSVIIFYSNFI